MYSERQRRFSRRLANCLALVLVCACAASWAHPELLAQIERLNEQIAVQPGNADLLLQRGDLYRRNGDYTSAWQDITAARALDPTLAEADFYAGRLALQIDDASSADAQLSRYLEQHPEHAAAWTLRGEARLALGQPVEAAADFGMAIETGVHPTPTLYLQQASALHQAGAGHSKAALAVIDQGLHHFPRDVALLGFATDTALDLGMYEKAQSYLATLPSAIRKLPQWQLRAARIASSPGGVTAEEPGTGR